MTDEQPAAANEVGSVAFDAADRLAIINTLGAYAYTYDQDRARRRHYAGLSEQLIVTNSRASLGCHRGRHDGNVGDQ